MTEAVATRHKVVEKLEKLIEMHEWGSKFEEAIANARQWNIPQMNDIVDLAAYLDWLDATLRWVPNESMHWSGKETYYRICLFYFVLDQKPVMALQTPVVPHGKAPELTPLSEWMREYADAWGEWMDDPDSINQESIQTFIEQGSFHMDEYMEDPSGWHTFNEFFARQIKPGMRPIAAIADDTVLVAPADCTFQGWWQVNRANTITTSKGLTWSLGELLEGSEYADAFNGGIFTHSFLNVNDYHRMHVPVGGRIIEKNVVRGQVYLNVLPEQVNPLEQPTGNDAKPEHKLSMIRSFEQGDHNEFNATDITGYQFAQSRGWVIIDSPIGLVCVMPMGMAQVSSVVIEPDLGATLYKGQEFAYFQFGGSDIIMLFQRDSNVHLSQMMNQHYNQGQKIGDAYPA